MAEMKHTPGPWEVSTLNGRTIGPTSYTHTDPALRGLEIPQMKAVAVVTDRIGETEANARLIAAAPELLSACEHAANYFRANGGAIAATIMEQCNAAIAKATGKGVG